VVPSLNDGPDDAWNESNNELPLNSLVERFHDSAKNIPIEFVDIEFCQCRINMLRTQWQQQQKCMHRRVVVTVVGMR
jgi:hypothetical protein